MREVDACECIGAEVFIAASYICQKNNYKMIITYSSRNCACNGSHHLGYSAVELGGVRDRGRLVVQTSDQKSHQTGH